MTHPSPELLVQYREDQNSLAEAERLTLQQHLESCSACSGRLARLGGFDFSLVNQWVEEEDRATEPLSPTPSLLSRLLDGFRGVFLHPAFAYGLAFLFAIPVIRTALQEDTGAPKPRPGSSLTEILEAPVRGIPATKDKSESPTATTLPPKGTTHGKDKSESPRPATTPPPRGTAHDDGPTVDELTDALKLLDRGPVRGLGPTDPTDSLTTLTEEEAITFLHQQYSLAYETRELEALERLWPMGEEWRQALNRLFTESRSVSVLLDIDHTAIEVNADGQEVRLPFSQAITVVDQAGNFSLRGPFQCVAALRKLDEDNWQITDIQDNPQQSAPCRPTG